MVSDTATACPECGRPTQQAAARQATEGVKLEPGDNTIGVVLAIAVFVFLVWAMTWALG
jgi:hypothetical protein